MADIFANRSSVTKKSNANSNFGGLGGTATADTQSRSKSNGHAQGAISRIHNMNKTQDLRNSGGKFLSDLLNASEPQQFQQSVFTQKPYLKAS